MAASAFIVRRSSRDRPATGEADYTETRVVRLGAQARHDDRAAGSVPGMFVKTGAGESARTFGWTCDWCRPGSIGNEPTAVLEYRFRVSVRAAVEIMRAAPSFHEYPFL
jgi:hypothetical protein